MPISLPDNVFKVVAWAITVVGIPWAIFITNRVQHIEVIETTMLKPSDISIMLSERSPYIKDLPRLVNERAEILAKLANIQIEIEAVKASFEHHQKVLETSYNRISQDVRGNSIDINSIWIAIEGIRTRIEMTSGEIPKKKRDQLPTRNGSGG